MIQIELRPKADTKLSHGGMDNRPPRHIVASVTAPGVKPQQFSNVALCGAKVTKLTPQHNGSICQACVDAQKRRPNW